jgi:nitrite reductase/ring-hydroxylating ferredoxin subunit
MYSLLFVDDQYYAVGNLCTRMGKFSDGLLDGENVTCLCRGSVFDVKTGNAMKGPAKKPTSVLEVKVEGDAILINF